ncbi:MAG: hypothetical protein NDI84_07995 [Steroidobacteraceae bacterium]|nr:hypothetical protein [Steroidobacteraceae bacterium]
MSIISTIVTPDAHTQRDGRRYIAEVHTFASGEVVTVNYLAEVGADTAVIATARKSALEAAMADSEAEAVTHG